MKTRISVVNNALVIESLYPLPYYVIQSILVFMENLLDGSIEPGFTFENFFIDKAINFYTNWHCL